ncbi:MAG: translation initiation factor [Saprospiraceae bacterium]|nr:translation initiation factor [Saprospiraceae bacterium]
MGKKKKRINVVYSTDPDYSYEQEGEVEDTLPNNEQYLEVYIEKKNRAGKPATVIRGFVGTTEDLKALAKQLKTKCGVGGSAKDGEIIIQGLVRDKVMDILQKDHYNVKRVGG